MANIFDLTSMDGNIIPEKARQNRVCLESLLLVFNFSMLEKKFELHDMTGLSKSLFFVDLVFLTANLTLGDLIPPCHRRRNVDSTVFIELSTTGIHTNTLSTTGGRRGDRLLPW